MRIGFIILCLLLPGFGYLRQARIKKFYSTFAMLYIVIGGGAILRLFPLFSGFIGIIFLILIIHLALHYTQSCIALVGIDKIV